MSLGKEDVDKLVQALNDVPEVQEDIKAALSDGDFSFLEGAGIAVKHGTKLIRTIRNANEIWLEIIDIESGEVDQVIEGLKGIYSPANPYVAEGAEDIAHGIVRLKVGAEKLAKAKQWEAENA